MNVALLNLGFDPVALIRRARQAGLVRVANVERRTLKDTLVTGSARRTANAVAQARHQAKTDAPIFGDRLRPGEAKEKILALEIGTFLPCADKCEVNKWQSLANRYGVHLIRVEGGLKRVGERVQTAATLSQRAGLRFSDSPKFKLARANK